MILAPRYEGPAILSIAGPPSDQLAPLTRQRRRMQAMLAELTDTEWEAASRCDGWAVRDVVAHLTTVNAFWHGSVVAGLAGTPTRVLGGFDPAVTPSLMVDRMSTLTSGDLFEALVSTNEGFLGVVAELDDNGWSTTAESPAGHVSIRLLAQHALWDCWVHERDVMIPLGMEPAAEADELRSCLQYSAAVSPVLGIGLQHACSRHVSPVEATEPNVRFVIDVAESVTVRDEEVPANVPCLRGNATTLIEALSLRMPMPPSTPTEWSHLLGGLQTAFDSVQSDHR